MTRPDSEAPDEVWVVVTRNGVIRLRPQRTAEAAAEWPHMGTPVRYVKAPKADACICADGGPGSYEGPMADCPVHGKRADGGAEEAALSDREQVRVVSIDDANLRVTHSVCNLRKGAS